MTQKRITCLYNFALAKTFLRLLALALIIGITTASFMSGRVKTSVETLSLEQFSNHAKPEPRSAHVSSSHRTYHIFAFGLTALVLLLLARNLRREIIAVSLIAGWATTIEVLQHLVGLSSTFEWWDLRDDLLGILLALATVKYALRDYIARRVDS